MDLHRGSAGQKVEHKRGPEKLKIRIKRKRRTEDGKQSSDSKRNEERK